jgi:hypothetical protein
LHWKEKEEAEEAIILIVLQKQGIAEDLVEEGLRTILTQSAQEEQQHRG